MPKSAQDKFNEYLNECRETRDALSAFERAVHEKYDGSGYAYIAGYMMMQLQDAITHLPRARRAEFRDSFRQAAQKFEHENLIRKIKDSDIKQFG
jgi:hypothetical protein